MHGFNVEISWTVRVFFAEEIIQYRKIHILESKNGKGERGDGKWVPLATKIHIPYTIIHLPSQQIYKSQ